MTCTESKGDEEIQKIRARGGVSKRLLKWFSFILVYLKSPFQIQNHWLPLFNINPKQQIELLCYQE